MPEDFSFKDTGEAAGLDDSTVIRAGLLERFIAKFIDCLIVGAFFAFPSFVGILAGATYILISDGLYNGRSIGKRIIGLKTVIIKEGEEREEGEEGTTPCDFRRSIIRNAEFGALIFLYIVLSWIPYAGKLIVVAASLAVAALEIGLIITDEASGARFGDRIAGTMVVPTKDYQ